jgi:hypothetical protein
MNDEAAGVKASMIERENGWTEFRVLICKQCALDLYAPGCAGLALAILRSGSCGHPYPGYA